MVAKAKDRLCVALDVATMAQAEKIADELVDYIGLFKIGMQLFTAEGPKAVNVINGLGGKVFLDLKFHDIPNTVAQAGREAVRLNVRMFNVHASGGSAMMRAVADAVRDESEKLGVEAPLIIAVTVLTSLDTRELQDDLGVSRTVEQQVLAMANLAKSSGLNGVVSSAKDTRRIREALGPGFAIVTPGIRPKWAAEKGDQKRVTTPADAISAGSDFIVVGRPILDAKDRAGACKKILKEMSEL